jgi:SAM-dependent methyltransferase
LKVVWNKCMQSREYVQYGCGLCAPTSWTNFDASPTLRIRRIPVLGTLLARGRGHFPRNVHYGDITKGLPIAVSSCEAIYCSHILEHLSLEDLRIALVHTYEYLKPGGVFRCVLPDLEKIASEYVASSAEQPAVDFMLILQGGGQWNRGLRGLLEWLGNSHHLSMWDYKSLAVELGRVGFTAIRRAAFGDAEDGRFRDVEHEIRWVDALGIECRKGGACSGAPPKA